ncbi:ATP-binding protein [Methylotenera sp.]|uniref:ATP-binding protein n=1 Tax=Methylotenera sp. TaxID=2051956 RepID=UPI0024880155|nr:ATP-binding protein [Methylotenera sp.]MDI1298305.1 sensor histidine kinase N-terminal domain-containing protein [Methylotenera sp.]
MNSLRLRLVLWLSLSLGAAWLVAAWFTHIESQEEINQLFDAQLAQSAQVLLETVPHQLHEQMEHGDNEVSVSHEYEQKLAFQIWSGEALLLRSAIAPTKAMASDKEGYSETTINGEALRVLTRWDARHDFMIQVAEPLAKRESLARHITLKMLIPSFIALPVFALLIWLGIGAGLRPLKQLKQEVKQRTANQLVPLAMQGVPEEVVPLVKALNELFARLDSAFESERRFTADAAHELRTPLAALKIQAQVAMRSSDRAERNTALENVLRGVDRAARLVQQLLTLARVDPETAVDSFKQVNLRALAASVMADLEPLAHTKQIELFLEEGQAANVLGDDSQLVLLLRNLLDNAIRYTPAGGLVSVSVSDLNGMHLKIRDTGPGIAEIERDQVLQRFYRITGSGEEGSGLGLSIVKRIADLHGARLELSSNEKGEGLLVQVIWPIT